MFLNREIASHLMHSGVFFLTVDAVVGTLHKLTAGDGYDYLTRQVAALDATERGWDSLEDYLSVRGESPGTWCGTGLSALGLQHGQQVTGGQMKNLFGEGLHPDALDIARTMAKAKAGKVAIRKAIQLGSRFRQYSGETPWRLALLDAYQGWRAVNGHPADDKIPLAVTSQLRTEVAGRLFHDMHRRAPAGESELSGFIRRMSRPQTTAIPGYDLTFTPVKSVSTLWAIAPTDIAAKVEAAHHEAVAAALAFLEEHAAYTRVGNRGRAQVDTTGLVGAQFVHRDSRAGDPNLHTHLVISAKVQTAGGRWLALDGRHLYAYNVAASEVYNSALETGILARLGGQFTPRQVGKGKRPIREYAAIPAALNEAFSARSRAIKPATAALAAKFLADHGRTPTAIEMIDLAQQATLATRQAKHEPRSLAEQRTAWRAQAIDVLGSETALNAVLARIGATPPARPVRDDDVLVRALTQQTLAAVSAARARWRHSNVVAEATRQARAAGVDPARTADLAQRITTAALSPEHSTALPSTGWEIHDDDTLPDELRRGDGTSVLRSLNQQLYTSPAIWEAEERVLAAAARTGALTVSDLDRGLAAAEWSANNGGATLNPGQAAMVDQVLTSGRHVDLALAPAGTGKTTVMGVITAAVRAAGGTVIGLAPQAVAAAELKSATAGIVTDTVDKLVYELTTTPPHRQPVWIRQIGPTTLVIIDEAGLASTPNLDVVTGYVVGRGGKILLVGDDRQRAAIGAGGVLRDIEAAHGAYTLTDVVRFENDQEGRASLALRIGDPAAAGFYLDNQRIHPVTAATAADTVFAAWHRDTAAGLDSVMLAMRLDLVAELNARARAARLTTHPLPAGAVEYRLPNGETVSTGDIIVTKQNNRLLPAGGTDHVKNGDRWLVEAVNPDGGMFVTHLTRGVKITLPAAYIARGDVRLGYAHTIPGAQGLTVGSRRHGRKGTAHTVFDPTMTRNEAYPGLTRATYANHAYPVLPDPDPDQLATPDAIVPRTGIDTFLDILATDGANRSVHTEIRDDADPHRQLGRAADAYAHALTTLVITHTGAQQLSALADRAEQLVPGITDSEAWDTLHLHLALLAGHGADPIRALGEVLHRRPLRGAADPAAVLDWRLDPTGNHSQGAGPLPWLPALPRHLTNPTWTALLTGWADRINSLTATLREQATGWTPGTAPRWAVPYLNDRHLVADLAVWRASESIDPTDLRPAGPQPRRLALRTHHRQLVDRAQKVTGDPRDGALRWEKLLDKLGANPTRDDWWPVLAAHLTLADRAGKNVPVLLATALDQRPLPVEAVAASLYWRLEPELRSLTIDPVAATTAHLLRPDWTTHLTDILGPTTADRIMTDPIWPNIVAQIDHAVLPGGHAAVPPAQMVRDAADLLHSNLATIPTHQLAAVLMLTITTLTDGAPPLPETLPPDPADHDLQPPDDWHTIATDHPDAAIAHPYAAIAHTDHSPTPTTDPTPSGDTPDADAGDPDEASNQAGTPATRVSGIEGRDRPATADRLRDIVAMAADFFTAAAPGSWVPDYIAGRGLDPNLFGYAPAGWTTLVDHLRGNGVTDPEMLAAGLARTSTTGRLIDAYRDRAIAPWHDPQGRIVSFAGRRNPTTDQQPADDHQQAPKYVNGATTTIFTKSTTPFGLSPQAIQSLKHGADLAIVEGPMDAHAINTAAALSGRQLVAAVAAGGTELGRQLDTLNQIAPLANRNILHITDNDPAGHHAAREALHKLITAGIKDPHTITLTGKDPAAMLETDGPHALAAALDHRRPLAAAIVDHILEQHTAHNPTPDSGMLNPELRLQLLNHTAPLLATINNNKQRHAETNHLAAHLGSDPRTIAAVIADHHAGIPDLTQQADEILPGITLDPQWAELHDQLIALAHTGNDPITRLHELADNGGTDPHHHIHTDVVARQLALQDGHDDQDAQLQPPDRLHPDLPAITKKNPIATLFAARTDPVPDDAALHPPGVQQQPEHVSPIEADDVGQLARPAPHQDIRVSDTTVDNKPTDVHETSADHPHPLRSHDNLHITAELPRYVAPTDREHGMLTDDELADDLRIQRDQHAALLAETLRLRVYAALQTRDSVSHPYETVRSSEESTAGSATQPPTANESIPTVEQLARHHTIVEPGNANEQSPGYQDLPRLALSAPTTVDAHHDRISGSNAVENADPSSETNPALAEMCTMESRLTSTRLLRHADHYVQQAADADHTIHQLVEEQQFRDQLHPETAHHEQMIRIKDLANQQMPATGPDLAVQPPAPHRQVIPGR